MKFGTYRQTRARRLIDAERHASPIAAEIHEDSLRRRVTNAEQQSHRRRAFTCNT